MLQLPPLETDDRCKCQNGDPNNEGKNTNAQGVCEHFCDKAGSLGKCGTGPFYERGTDHIDCRGKYNRTNNY